VSDVNHRMAWFKVVVGFVLTVAGLVITTVTLAVDPTNDAYYAVTNLPFAPGFWLIVRGTIDLTRNQDKGRPIPLPEDQGLIPRLLLLIGGYRGFVAQRYLLVPSPHVTRTTKWVVSCLLVLLVLSISTLGTGIDDRRFWANPIWTLNLVLGALLAVVLVTRVLIYTRPALYLFIFGVVILLWGMTISWMMKHQILFHHGIEGIPPIQKITVISLHVAGGVLAGLALFFGCLRAFFTFFTTVPIGGVWIGTAALVCVLAVMSGFETDLREKILGSNAHIQITREEGDMVEWRAVYDRVTKLNGVVAATPYATSEVVIASNNNGLNVIIKGIDPKTVGKVTDLVKDLEDKSAMKNLEGKHDSDLDLRVPQTGSGAGSAVDPGPANLPSSGDPIDFSAPAPEPAAGSAAAPHAGSDTMAGADTYKVTATDPIVVGTPPIDDKPGERPARSTAEGGAEVNDKLGGPPPARRTAEGGAEVNDKFGGDAQDLIADPNVVDPPPLGMVTSDAPPIDYSKPRTATVDPQIRVLDIPSDSPSTVRRTESLPGVLVGTELVKQMHLYVGQEARLVSPLSDPSNPDATGTPIPFNRDYRIAGIFFTGMYEYDLKFIYVSLDSLQDFLDRGDAVDGIEVRIGSPDDTDRYVRQISQVLGPQYRVLDWKELNRSLFSALKLEKIAMFLVLGIVILVASFSIVGNLIMVVVEKQREIALLKTLGASDPGIMQLFAIQGLLIGLIGTMLGVATGLVACYIGKRVGIPLNPDVYYIDRMPVNVDSQSVAMTFLAGVLVSIVATFYPAILGARVRPATGMRH